MKALPLLAALLVLPALALASPAESTVRHAEPVKGDCNDGVKSPRHGTGATQRLQHAGGCNR